MIQRREQQAAATSAGETERPDALRIDSLLSGKHLERHQVVGEYCACECLAQRTGGLGKGVLVQPRRQVKPFLIGWTQTLLPPQSILGLDEGGEPRRGTG